LDVIWPFVIFALPRSRTAWLSQWLSYQNRIVGHDLGAYADTCQGFLDALWPFTGTVETGAQDAHRLMRIAMPDAKFVTIRRQPINVADSLTKFGIMQYDEMERRAEVLDDIERDGALSIPYESLSDARVCANLWEHLLPGVPFNFNWWRYMDQQNIQIDVAAHLQLLAERQPQLDKLAEEVANTVDPHYHRIGWEPFANWPECEALALVHAEEANDGARHGRPFKVNTKLLQEMENAGQFLCVGARINGKLVGYLTWSFIPDIESEGVTIADQGAWFVTPDAPGWIGPRMLKQSIAAFKAMGVQVVELHHQLNGRGARLGTLFKRMGAIELQHRYSLWIGD
jgi:hypothetical protein